MKDLAGVDRAALLPYRDDIEKAGSLMQKRDRESFVEALAIVNRLSEQVARPSPAAGLIDGMKGTLLAALGPAAPAKTALLSSLQQYQGNAEMIGVLAYLQLVDRKPAELLKTLNVALVAQPKVIQTLEPDWTRQLWAQIRSLPEVERQNAGDEFSVILAGARWRLDPRTVEGDQILGNAIEAHVRHGRLQQARALIAERPTAAILAHIAADKRYEAIWPDLAPFVATGFRRNIADDVTLAEAGARKTPQDFAAVTRYIRALRIAGRMEDAVSAGKALADSKALIEASGDAAFWFVNDYAYALASAGKVDEALARMDGSGAGH